MKPIKTYVSGISVYDIGYPVTEDNMYSSDWKKHSECNNLCRLEVLLHFVKYSAKSNKPRSK